MYGVKRTGFHAGTSRKTKKTMAVSFPGQVRRGRRGGEGIKGQSKVGRKLSLKRLGKKILGRPCRETQEKSPPYRLCGYSDQEREKVRAVDSEGRRRSLLRVGWKAAGLAEKRFVRNG